MERPARMSKMLRLTLFPELNMSTAVAEPRRETKEARVNFLAEESWVKRVEKAARAMGVSLSAYIRIACNEKIKRDAKRDDE